MSNGNGHRWLKFWPQDWQNDPDLKLCSLAAQAVWIRLLCMMHAGNGELLVNGQQPTDREIAIITTVPEKQVKRCIAELLARGVASRNDAGTIYSSRMQRDLAASEDGKKWGKKGGNPALNPQGGLTPPVNHTRKGNGVNPDPYHPPLNQNLESETEQEKEESKVSIYNYPLSSTGTRAREAPSGSDGTQIPLAAMSYDELHDVPTLTEIRKNREAFARDNAAAVTTGAGVRRVARTLSLSRPAEPQRSKWQQIAAVTEPAKPTTASSYAVPARTPEQQLAELLGIPVTEAATRFQAHAA